MRTSRLGRLLALAALAAMGRGRSRRCKRWQVLTTAETTADVLRTIGRSDDISNVARARGRALAVGGAVSGHFAGTPHHYRGIKPGTCGLKERQSRRLHSPARFGCAE